MTIKPNGFHADGGNLFLRVRDDSRVWIFRYKKAGKQTSIGLGATHTRSLAEARDLAALMRNAIANDNDPAEFVTQDISKVMTFKECALALIESKRPSWSNEKHVQQMEVLYKILTLDSSIKDVQIKNQLFVEAGFTLALFNNPQLTQDDIKTCRDKLASLCAELAGFREQTFYFLSPRYGCAKNIPDKEMIKFIKKILIDLGFNTETKETRSGDRDRELVISVPRVMVHRLGIEIKPSKHQIEQLELKDPAYAVDSTNDTILHFHCWAKAQPTARCRLGLGPERTEPSACGVICI